MQIILFKFLMIYFIYFIIYTFRYYKKTDIDREANDLVDDEKFDSISDFEVFKSNHRDIIYIETILSTCHVYTFEEYEVQEKHSQTTFFCRASYDPLTVINTKYLMLYKLLENFEPFDR